MRLLIITQKVDVGDDNLGYFHGWIEEFAKYCESIIVVCLQKGEYHLPANVKILSLGKPASRLRYLFNFYKYIWQERRNYDAVFVHMNPEYAILGGLFWKIFGKKIYLWYTHGTAGFSLKLAEKFVDKIFTASTESCRIKSEKIVVTGHGIDSAAFQPQSQKPKAKSQKFAIVTAGRITSSKNLDLLISAAEILRGKNFDFEIKIAGAPVFETDKIYLEKLRKWAGKEINFVGPVSHRNMPDFYREADLFVNFSDTGSIDKSVLEAMVSGLPVLTSNEAFKKILAEKYVITKNPEEIAEKIMTFSQSEPDPNLRDYVVKSHNLESLVRKILINL